MSHLAVHGGTPVRTTPFSPWPTFSSDEIEQVQRVLSSGKVNYWTGEQCTRFESEFAKFVACKYAICLANGTVALEAALTALDIGPGDEVIVPSKTFIATASAVVRVGGTPVIADIDPISQTITAETANAVLSHQTKAVICVHLAGWPCDMFSLQSFCKKNNLRLIEDCAQAHGARYHGQPVGSFGDIAAFSFCQDKIMTTGGEGGMITTQDSALYHRVWSLKDHGKNKDKLAQTVPSTGFRWVHDTFGTNFRLTEMQAAIGRQQLQKLSDWISLRQNNAAALTQGFSTIPGLIPPCIPSHIDHAFYKYYVFFDPASFRHAWTKSDIIAAIVAEGIPCFSGSCSEIYHEKAFERFNRDSSSPPFCPQAKKTDETSLMFLVHPTLSRDDMQDTCAAVKKVFTSLTSS